ncbi:MAG: hypothetical protein HZB38_05930 [Planctomycetes bacterium]|nr:hypothetical protein [Planctomycetota bacterium]
MRRRRLAVVKVQGMQEHRPTGWNTWDFRGFNRIVYLNRGATELIIEVAIWDEDHRPADEIKNRGGLHRVFRWTDVTRLGEHAPLRLPATLEFTIGGTAFHFDAQDRAGELNLSVKPLSTTAKRVAFLFIAPVGENLARSKPKNYRFAGAGIASGTAALPGNYFVNTDQPFLLGSAGAAATIRVRPKSLKTGGSGARRANAAKTTSPPLAGSGALADVPRAMTTAVTWNTLYDTRRRLVSSPVSRDWCADWKGVAVWCWDTFMIAAMISIASPELARLNFEAVTAAIDELGMVPNYYFSHGAASKDRSMPCLGSYMIWKTQAARPDKAWLRAIYPRLATWHRYWMKHRDGNGDGLLEWGSDDKPRFEFPQLLQDNPQLQHSAKCAMYESGLDNSPMYDDVPFNADRCTLELADVGLNCYYAMDCEALARIAECIGKPREAAAYRREYELMRRRINESLWDEAAGIYCNRHWDGRLSRRWAPTSFFPMIAGVAPQERAERMVREHLCNPAEFWGEWVIPSIARNDPAFPDNDYWRGRIWGPFNLLFAEGLRRYRMDDVAAEFTGKSLALFMKNWREDGGVYENYNAVTGKGADVWNAARLYHWGGLMAFVAIEELIDVEVAGWLRLGSLKFPAARIQNVRIGDNSYDVDLGDRLRVLRNGKLLLECTSRVIVRIPLSADLGRPIEVSAAGSGKLTLYGADFKRHSASIDGGAAIRPKIRGTTAMIEW